MAQELYSSSKYSEESKSTNGARTTRVLLPTKCNDSAIEAIHEFLGMIGGKISVDFLNILPPSHGDMCFPKNMDEAMYDRAIAERELYRFTKKLPKRENVVYNYRVAEGDLFETITGMSNDGKYDLIAMEAKDFCYRLGSIMDVTKLLDSVRIPIVLFGGRIRSEGRDEQHSEVNI
ncbi:hypothetical protein [Thermoplasma sp.]|uniref:universal stress protein n=1 Tax=Thermoplasma sp. TaxID=1973142 RepID=UPI00128A4615|nr:hypothetical protein [Thermoplasma sp.]KAA8921930.1 MAG: hypothetical protein F6Q11_06995 [Thermoplasma sp.]